jgi:acyl-CoA reductase-like NAD-dependent aldehyde dehydrogenase
MKELVQFPGSPADITAAAATLRTALADGALSLADTLAVFESWAAALSARELDAIPGVAFLRLWLRRGTLEPIINRELGPGAMAGDWAADGRARLRPFPLGVVGHWPAGNIEIQPILSMTCGLLGGNAALVRIPSDLVEVMRQLMAPLAASAGGERLLQRIALLAFDHGRQELQAAMAQAVDGAMIWGGKEAVLSVRSLPFPSWARLAVFGPRLSVAAMDAAAWGNAAQREAWCQRIARDVWQFEQQACSSPQTLFLEKKPGCSSAEFVAALKRAFEVENRQHPRQTIHPALTSAICQARAAWLLADTARQAFFPQGPDWTLLVGSGSDIPTPTQGKTLTVLEVDSLSEPLSKFDGNVQTLGLGVGDAGREAELALLAGKRGVDRVVKLGRMHLFVPPWDGADLIRPMVRMVRHLPSTE